MRFGLSAAVALLLAGTAALAARPWPGSETQIVVFADQLPSGLTAAQRQFAATRLAGTQKMLRSDIRAIRTYNTNFLCIHYQLAVGCGPAAFIIGDEWSSDWATVNTRTNWFLRNPSAQRVHQTAWGWDLMDVTYTSGVPVTPFPQYWTTSCLARIRAAEDDGVFADSFTQDAYSFGQCSPSHPWLEDVGSCLANWVPHLNAFGSAVRTAFDADTNGFKFLPNLGGLITGWDTTAYGVGHGGMIEGFCYWGPASYLDPADWALQMDRALALVRSNKIVICQSYPDPASTRERLFALGSYLLIKGSRTYINLLGSDSVALEYYPEYQVALAGATAAPAASSAALWHAPWGVYRRAYTNGLVLVNPGSTAAVIANLGTNYARVIPSGGGPVDSSGGYGGSLSYQTVTSLTVAAYGAEILLRTTNSVPAAPSNAPPASGFTAYHRSGQTFLTWAERADLSGESYRVYRHTAPITTNNLAQAARLYTVPEGSSRFHASRYMDDVGAWRHRYADGLVVTNGGQPLPASAGVLVWTLEPQDFTNGASGTAYYAVTVVPAGGSESAALSSSNTAGPVAESVADPLPVEIGTNIGAGGHAYVQYMNLRRWNPTFHAPNPGNGWYGLDPAAPGVTGAIQYAYDYAVFEPDAPANPAAIYMNLHGWGGNTYGPAQGDPEPYSWPSYKIFPTDVSETWYFGFARSNDYRRSQAVPAGDTIVNYTEQRLLRMVYDLMRQPPGSAVDTNRVFVWGHSMGGSGTLALALRYPNVFAAACSSQPMTDYAHSGDGGGTDWRSDVEPKWGAPALNLPVAIDAPGGWAAHLQRYNGTGVWDWQNHRSNLTARAADDSVPLGIGHGTLDTVIEWSTQGQPAYAALNGSRRCWGGITRAVEHGWMGFDACPAPIDPDSSLAPFANFTARRNETVPGLASASGDPAFPPSGPAEYHQYMEWSASWNAWDGTPVDTTNRWRMSLRSLSGGTQRVDVTPRRLQRFHRSPGEYAHWHSTAVGGTATQEAGIVRADSAGLLTVTGLTVTAAGRVLELEVDDRRDTDGDGMADYWELRNGLSWTSAADRNGNPDGDGLLNWQEYVADTSPTSATSTLRVRAVSNSPLRVYFDGSSNRQYTLGYRAVPGTGAWSNLPGQVRVPGPATLTDTNLGSTTMRVYRVQVDVP